ncbi:MAG: hypothetical protein HYY40_11810 [Bacteroidetes bacterium]|nr:hypothetical protein [Bacteroidota bacterium]
MEKYLTDMRLLFWILPLILTASCRQTPGWQDDLDPMEYVNWVEDMNNGLKVSKQIGNIRFTLQFKPLEYIILKENGNPDAGKEEIIKEMEQMKDMQYYTFTISADDHLSDILKYNLNDPADYYFRLNYFASEMQDDLALVEGTDTLRCLLFHYERNYGLAPYTNFLLAFEKKENGEEIPDRTLIFDDGALNSGIVKITINGAALNRMPKLFVTTMVRK